MIVLIRGTNGSGKSYAVRQILAKSYVLQQSGTLPCQSQLILPSRVKHPVLVIGPYAEERSMGGCDCIRRPAQIYRLIDRAVAREWHVLLEGVVLATKPYLDYASAGHDVRYAFLDPPRRQCLANIDARQALRGRFAEVSSAAMDHKHARAHRMWVDAQREGLVTQRFTDADSVVRWTLYQLRHP